MKKNMSLYLIPGLEKIQGHRTEQSTHCALHWINHSKHLKVKQIVLLYIFSMRVKGGAKFFFKSRTPCFPISTPYMARQQEDLSLQKNRKEGRVTMLRGFDFRQDHHPVSVVVKSCNV